MAVAEQTAAAPTPGFLRNRWVRILGVAFVMYVLSYIDRVNIAMGAPAMRVELGLSPATMGFAVGLFPWGYIILQIPAGRLAACGAPSASSSSS